MSNNRIVATVSRKLATTGKDGRSDYGSNGASFTVELDITPEMIENPQYLLERGRSAYALAEAMVAEQLVRSTPRPKIQPMTQAEVDAPEVNPAVARMSQPPPSPPAASPPPPIASNGQSGDDRPPTSAKSLGGWSKKHGLTKWFSDLGRANKRNGLISEWDDAFAKWAYAHWLSQQSVPTTPAVPSTNGNGHPPY
jgi:hypothetical protein